MATPKNKATEAPKSVETPVEDKTTADYVAARSTDGSSGNRYKKTFIILAEPKWNESEYDHKPNLVGTLSEALIRGLHPLGEAKFDGDSIQSDGVSVELTYSVEVKPVEDKPTSTETVAPSQSEHIN